VQDKNVFLKGTAQVVMKSDLKYLIEQRALWLSRVFQVALCSARAPKNWQASMIIPIRKKGDTGNELITDSFRP